MNGLHKSPPSLSGLLSGWLSVSLLFLSCQMVYAFGALAGFLLAGAFFTGFMLALPFLFAEGSRTESSIFLRIARLLSAAESFALLFLIIGLLATAVVSTVSTAAFLLLLIVAVAALALFWRTNRERMVLLHSFLLLGTAIFMPSYVYLQKGLETVYHNLLYYYPQYLHIEQPGAWRFFGMLTLIFFAKLQLQLPSLRIAPRQGVKKMAVGALLWTTVALAFSTMTVVAVNNHLPSDQNRIILSLITFQEGSILGLGVLAGLILSSFIELGRTWDNLAGEPRLLRVVLAAGSGVYALICWKRSIPVLSTFLYFGTGIAICTILALIRHFHHLDIKTVKLRINEIFKPFL